ncbi:hypothetical protein ACOCJ7_14045 [Knoellia sp. CPCC 206453]|uniref:hypothetical protein n=1 Tax=Knoellia pratensis TaxID=3404796 RepID=UPI003620A42E
MTSIRSTRGSFVATVLVAVLAACSTEASTRDLGGRETPVASPTAPASPAPTGTSTSTPTAATPVRPAAVTKELDELARNLRDLSHAASSRDAMPAVASALAATRTEVKELRDKAYGPDKSCATVESALSRARLNAARTAAAAAAVRSRNAVRSALLVRARATLGRLGAASTAGGRTSTADEAAALAQARTTIEGAADQISGTEQTANSAVASAQDLRVTADTVAAKAC